MIGMVRLVLAKYVWLHPGTGYILMNYINLVDMTGPEMGIGFFLAGADRLPICSCGNSWFEYGRGARGVKLIR